MNIFTEKAKQKVLDTLYDLATEAKSTNVSAIKLYLELAGDQSPAESLTTEQALEILRCAATHTEPEQQ